MTKWFHLRRLLKILLVAVGAGIGLWITELLLPFFRRLFPQLELSALSIYAIYAVMSLIGAGVFFLARENILNELKRVSAYLEHRWDNMPGRQIFLRASGLLLGLLLALLCSQLLLSTGASMLTVSTSALLYVLFGYMGLRLGDKRYRSRIKHDKEPGRGFFSRKHKAEESNDLGSLLEEIASEADSAQEDAAQSARVKILDSSLLIDGRVQSLYRSGLLEGTLLIPSFVVDELQRLSDSADSAKRARGRRGLDQISALKSAGAPVQIESLSLENGITVDSALLQLTAEHSGILLSNDTNLCKAAAATDVKTLNLHELVNDLRGSLCAGDTIQADIIREGKEPGQGVAYLEDGTMLVVEGARTYLGKRVRAIVTSVLQTSAGRMVFARMEDPDP